MVNNKHYILGSVSLKKKMNYQDMMNYIDELNESSKKIHGGVGTLCSDGMVKKTITEYGEFVLGIIPSEKLPYRRSPNGRENKVSELFSNEPVNISEIPPIIIRGFYNEQDLITLDGFTRSTVAHKRNVPLLGYVPEKLCKQIEGFEIME